MKPRLLCESPPRKRPPCKNTDCVKCRTSYLPTQPLQQHLCTPCIPSYPQPLGRTCMCQFNHDFHICKCNKSMPCSCNEEIVSDQDDTSIDRMDRDDNQSYDSNGSDHSSPNGSLMDDPNMLTEVSQSSITKNNTKNNSKIICSGVQYCTPNTCPNDSKSADQGNAQESTDEMSQDEQNGKNDFTVDLTVQAPKGNRQNGSKNNDGLFTARLVLCNKPQSNGFTANLTVSGIGKDGKPQTYEVDPNQSSNIKDNEMKSPSSRTGSGNMNQTTVDVVHQPQLTEKASPSPTFKTIYRSPNDEDKSVYIPASRSLSGKQRDASTTSGHLRDVDHHSDDSIQSNPPEMKKPYILRQYGFKSRSRPVTSSQPPYMTSIRSEATSRSDKATQPDDKSQSDFRPGSIYEITNPSLTNKPTHVSEITDRTLLAADISEHTESITDGSIESEPERTISIASKATKQSDHGSVDKSRSIASRTTQGQTNEKKSSIQFSGVSEWRKSQQIENNEDGSEQSSLNTLDTTTPLAAGQSIISQHKHIQTELRPRISTASRDTKQSDHGTMDKSRSSASRTMQDQANEIKSSTIQFNGVSERRKSQPIENNEDGSEQSSLNASEISTPPAAGQSSTSQNKNNQTELRPCKVESNISRKWCFSHRSKDVSKLKPCKIVEISDKSERDRTSNISSDALELTEQSIKRDAKHSSGGFSVDESAWTELSPGFAKVHSYIQSDLDLTESPLTVPPPELYRTPENLVACVPKCTGECSRVLPDLPQPDATQMLYDAFVSAIDATHCPNTTRCKSSGTNDRLEKLIKLYETKTTIPESESSLSCPHPISIKAKFVPFGRFQFNRQRIQKQRKTVPAKRNKTVKIMKVNDNCTEGDKIVKIDSDSNETHVSYVLETPTKQFTKVPGSAKPRVRVSTTSTFQQPLADLHGCPRKNFPSSAFRVHEYNGMQETAYGAPKGRLRRLSRYSEKSTALLHSVSEETSPKHHLTNFNNRNIPMQYCYKASCGNTNQLSRKGSFIIPSKTQSVHSED